MAGVCEELRLQTQRVGELEEASRRMEHEMASVSRRLHHGDDDDDDEDGSGDEGEGFGSHTSRGEGGEGGGRRDDDLREQASRKRGLGAGEASMHSTNKGGGKGSGARGGGRGSGGPDDPLDALTSSPGGSPYLGRGGESEGGGSAGPLLLTTQLYSQLEAVRRDLTSSSLEINAVRAELGKEREEKKKLEKRVEELVAFLDRTQRLRDNPDAAINMEYLKNCVSRFMATNELSEKKRLAPVLVTILKLTEAEKAQVCGVLWGVCGAVVWTGVEVSMIIGVN